MYGGTEWFPPRDTLLVMLHSDWQVIGLKAKFGASGRETFGGVLAANGFARKDVSQWPRRGFLIKAGRGFSSGGSP